MNEKAKKSSASKCRQFGKNHERDFIWRLGRGGRLVNVSEGEKGGREARKNFQMEERKGRRTEKM